jgi:CheY-like chemotaxis protein
LADNGKIPGGSSVAKILVADDNSNIQKMVGLALKDHGIEVVAVGNGEAAVRKISDIHPDLVLADVFMPVRNGYEVCKYVKDDSALSHIPVILLVGAFDPLDEQEAQRAGADGVLKKPFVPPDPLISMVKSALVRAGVAHAGFTPPKPAAEAAPEPPVEVPRTVAPPAPLPSFETESFVDDGPAQPAAVKIESDQQPVAFGSLLGTEEEDAAMTAVPAIDRDWRTEEVEEEEEEQQTDSKASWRRDGDDDDSGVESPVREGGWRDSASDEQPVHTHAKHHEPWTPTREKQDMSEAAETEGEASGSPISDFRNIPAAPFSGAAWAAAIEAGGQNHTAVAEAERPAIHDSVAARVAPDLDTLVGHAEPEMESVPAVEDQSFVTETPVPAPTTAVHAAEEPTSAPGEARQASEPSSFVSEPVKSSAASWFSTPPSPWDAEMQKASKLASTWDTPVAPPVAIETHPSEPFAVASTAPDEIEVVSGAAVSAVIPEAVETAREEASHGATEVDMNAVVEKVMARMSPDKLHELTRDLLKPVIEGIVREELNKKS